MVAMLCKSMPAYFFFASGRRHTRFVCDWSSGVCSSDLGLILLLTASVLVTPRVVAASTTAEAATTLVVTNSLAVNNKISPGSAGIQAIGTNATVLVGDRKSVG